MEFWSPLRAHAEWMAQLREFIYGRGEMDADLVARSEVCPLGLWLHGPGRVYAHLAEHQAVVEAHAAFHRCAAGAVRMVDAGDRTGALAQLNAGGDLRRHSRAVVRSLQALNQRIARDAADDGGFAYLPVTP